MQGGFHQYLGVCPINTMAAWGLAQLQPWISEPATAAAVLLSSACMTWGPALVSDCVPGSICLCVLHAQLLQLPVQPMLNVLSALPAMPTGITAAQALGAPLAAGLLAMHGAANMSGRAPLKPTLHLLQNEAQIAKQHTTLQQYRVCPFLTSTLATDTFRM